MLACFFVIIFVEKAENLESFEVGIRDDGTLNIVRNGFLGHGDQALADTRKMGVRHGLTLKKVEGSPREG